MRKKPVALSYSLWDRREERVAVAMRMRGKSCKDIGSLLNRPWQSVQAKLKALGVAHPTRKKPGDLGECGWVATVRRLDDRIRQLEHLVASLVTTAQRSR